MSGELSDNRSSLTVTYRSKRVLKKILGYCTTLFAILLRSEVNRPVFTQIAVKIVLVFPY